MKMAGGMPDKTPKPISYPATKSPASILGPDSTSDSPWTDPKVDQTPVPKGKKPSKDLMSDTSSDNPWADPKVNTRPQEPTGKGGLPNTELGQDTTKKPVKWAEKSYVPSEDNEDHYDPTVNEEPELGDGEKPSDPKEFFKGGSIVDSFEGKEDRGPSYRELVAASPSANLLRDITDPYKWNMNRVLDKLAAPEKEAAAKTAGPAIKERWTQDGGYDRHLEVESAEDLHKLVQALGGEEVEWNPETKAPNQANPMGQEQPANPMANMGQPGGQPMASVSAKRAQYVDMPYATDPTTGKPVLNKGNKPSTGQEGVEAPFGAPHLLGQCLAYFPN
jgi:hypothetical protein